MYDLTTNKMQSVYSFSAIVLLDKTLFYVNKIKPITLCKDELIISSNSGENHIISSSCPQRDVEWQIRVIFWILDLPQYVKNVS